MLEIIGHNSHKAFLYIQSYDYALAKRRFTIDTGKEQIPVEGQVHRNVAVKYLMKRRRSLLMTKNSEKVEKLEAVFAKIEGGITDLDIGPDGLVYIVSHNGKILRLEPIPS